MSNGNQTTVHNGPPSWHLRGAALLALIVPPAMAILTAVALAGHVGVALLAIALILLASGAIWVALTSRGMRRAVSAALATLAVLGLIAVIVTHWRGVLFLLALLALLSLFGLCARDALGRSGAAAVRRLAGNVVAVGAARSPALIINPWSGGGKAQRFDLPAEAGRRGVTPIVMRPGDDLLTLAQRAIAGGAQAIGMAGGDGSQALVAGVAAQHGVAHVCIPAGTRNHFALDLGLNRDDVIGALEAFTDGVERRIDLAKVNGRVFVNNASLGVYAQVVQSPAYRDAKLATWTSMLPDLLGTDATPIDLRFQTPDGSICSDAPLVLVSNNPYQLTHLAGAGTRERIDTGMLSVVAARVRSSADVSKLVALELAGQVGRFTGLISWSALEFEVHSSGSLAVGLDGEALMLQPPLRFESLPGALRVRLPRSAGLAPAARATPLTSTNLGALVRVVAGR
ncbi:MAG: diacylglycerol kinase family protein [Solirubrobacteraceae bacterium]